MNNYDSERDLRDLNAPRRNNYFYGKLMDVPHFEMEQSYNNRKRWLLNRLGLGYGVLCGLNLTVKEKQICVSPGVAIDTYGREIVVPNPVCIDPWTLTDQWGSPAPPPLSNTAAHEVVLTLGYRECHTDFMPVLVSDCNSTEQSLPGTKVESYFIAVHEVKEHSQGVLPAVDDRLCKILGSDASEAEKRSKMCELLRARSCDAFRGDVGVVLGAVSLNTDGKIDEGKLDQCSYRNTLVSNQQLLDMLFCMKGATAGEGTIPTRETLTNIKNISGWTHDGETRFKEFPEKLEITFSNEVTDGMKLKAVLRPWFIVTLEFPEPDIGNQTALVAAANSGYGSTRLLQGKVAIKGSKATFSVDQAFIDATRQITEPPTGTETTTLNALCRIVVKCDFLLDANRKAVDGNHLGGILPTGDGIAGGDFDSWFWATMVVEKR